ncbi:hypothetical protein ACFS07_02345 [Undibacterium arcticum]
MSPTLVEPTIPVIYGRTDQPSTVTDDYIYLPIDVFFGSAFFSCCPATKRRSVWYAMNMTDFQPRHPWRAAQDSSTVRS